MKLEKSQSGGTSLKGLMFGGAREKLLLQEEMNELKRKHASALEEHRTQNEALKLNMKHTYTENQRLQEQVASYKAQLGEAKSPEELALEAEKAALTATKNADLLDQVAGLQAATQSKDSQIASLKAEVDSLLLRLSQSEQDLGRARSTLAATVEELQQTQVKLKTTKAAHQEEMSKVLQRLREADVSLVPTAMPVQAASGEIQPMSGVGGVADGTSGEGGEGGSGSSSSSSGGAGGSETAAVAMAVAVAVGVSGEATRAAGVGAAGADDGEDSEGDHTGAGDGSAAGAADFLTAKLLTSIQKKVPPLSPR